MPRWSCRYREGARPQPFIVGNLHNADRGSTQPRQLYTMRAVHRRAATRPVRWTDHLGRPDEAQHLSRIGRAAAVGRYPVFEH